MIRRFLKSFQKTIVPKSETEKVHQRNIQKEDKKKIAKKKDATQKKIFKVKQRQPIKIDENKTKQISCKLINDLKILDEVKQNRVTIPRKKNEIDIHKQNKANENDIKNDQSLNDIIDKRFDYLNKEELSSFKYFNPVANSTIGLELAAEKEIIQLQHNVEKKEKNEVEDSNSNSNFHLELSEEKSINDVEPVENIKPQKTNVKTFLTDGLWRRLLNKREDKKCYPVRCLICGYLDENGNIRRHLKTHKMECKCKKRAKYCSCESQNNILKQKHKSKFTKVDVSEVQDIKYSNINLDFSEDNVESTITNGSIRFKTKKNIGLWQRFLNKQEGKKCYPVKCLICGHLDQNGNIRRHLKTHKIECKCKKRAKYCSCEIEDQVLSIKLEKNTESKMGTLNKADKDQVQTLLSSSIPIVHPKPIINTHDEDNSINNHFIANRVNSNLAQKKESPNQKSKKLDEILINENKCQLNSVIGKFFFFFFLI
jgi:hypothetical protein